MFRFVFKLPCLWRTNKFVSLILYLLIGKFVYVSGVPWCGDVEALLIREEYRR